MTQIRLSGAGVGWRPAIADLLRTLTSHGRLGFTEVVAENVSPQQPPVGLVAMASRIPVIPHGVTLGLAGADEPDFDRLLHLGGLAERFGSPLVSEHVAFVRAAQTPDPMHPEVLEAGHLMPPPRTREALDVLVENIHIAQEHLPVPLAVENIAALVTWPEDEYDEGDFLSELVERTGVQLVFDVANLFASATARGSDPARDLARFPLEAVAYCHIAGGTFRDGLYLDTHAHDVIEPVADLLAQTLERWPGESPGVLLERDEDIDPVGVEAEFDQLERIVRKMRT
jgi:uncharacterized protein